MPEQRWSWSAPWSATRKVMIGIASVAVFARLANAAAARMNVAPTPPHRAARRGEIPADVRRRPTASLATVASAIPAHLPQCFSSYGVNRPIFFWSGEGPPSRATVSECTQHFDKLVKLHGLKHPLAFMASDKVRCGPEDMLHADGMTFMVTDGTLHVYQQENGTWGTLPPGGGCSSHFLHLPAPHRTPDHAGATSACTAA